MSKNIYRVPRWVKKRIEVELYQYYDNKVLLKEFEEDVLEESPFNDGQPRGNQTSDTTSQKAIRLVDRTTRVLIETERRLRYIENAIKKLTPEEKKIFEYIFKDGYNQVLAQMYKYISKDSYYNTYNKAVYYTALEFGYI